MGKQIPAAQGVCVTFLITLLIYHKQGFLTTANYFFTLTKRKQTNGYPASRKPFTGTAGLLQDLACTPPPAFTVMLKLGTIYPGPKAAIRFRYCKKLLKLMPTYDAEVLRVINRTWPKQKRNRGSDFSKAFFPLVSPQSQAEPQPASKALAWIHSVMLTR